MIAQRGGLATPTAPHLPPPRGGHLKPAERTLRSLGIGHPQEIDVEAIAFAMGAQVKYRPLGGCEASIVGVGDRAIIRVDPSVLPERRRFSTAHECGHWFHHRGRPFHCRATDIGNPARRGTDPERIADGYATDLLMPRYLFEPAAARHAAIGFETVWALQRLFRTSLLATALRLVELGPEPLLLICHQGGRRRWFRPAKTIPRQWFPKPLLDPDSYAWEIARGDATYSGRRGRMPADVWFQHDAAYELEVVEESIDYGDRVLSLISFPQHDW